MDKKSTQAKDVDQLASNFKPMCSPRPAAELKTCPHSVPGVEFGDAAELEPRGLLQRQKTS